LSEVETSLHLQSPDAKPVFATTAPAANLAHMPMLEINATRPSLTSRVGKVTEVERWGSHNFRVPLASALSVLRRAFTREPS